MNDTIVVHVESGETLSEIAAQYGVTVEQLQEWNQIEEPNYVMEGQRVVVHEATVPSGWDEAAGAWAPWIGGALALALLLFLFLGKRKAPTSAPDSGVALPTGESHRHGPRHAAVSRVPAPTANAGELLIRSVLTRHYRDWPLFNDVLLPSGGGTAQIDHILISPGGVFVIETKDMNGWIFASPGQRRWTQTYMADRWSRMVGIRSNRFTFYNPLLQNVRTREGPGQTRHR